MKNVIVVCGYTNSGKSTVINHLRDIGIPAVSSSEHIHDVASTRLASRLRITKEEAQELIHRLKRTSEILIDGMTARQYLIHTAEEYLVKTFGRRDGIVKPTFDRGVVMTGDTFAMESIGGIEFEILKDLCHESGVSLRVLAVRRKTEQPGVDIREIPAEAIHVYNDASVEKLLDQIEKFIYE